MRRLPTYVDIELHDAIKRRLKARKISLSDIAAEAGFGLSLVSMVSQGHRRNATVEGLIADKLGERPETLWPSRYKTEEDAR